MSIYEWLLIGAFAAIYVGGPLLAIWSHKP